MARLVPRGLRAAALLLTACSTAAVPGTSAAAAASVVGSAPDPKRLEAIAGGSAAEEDGSACLLQREGRALASARSPAVAIEAGAVGRPGAGVDVKSGAAVKAAVVAGEALPRTPPTEAARAREQHKQPAPPSRHAEAEIREVLPLAPARSVALASAVGDGLGAVGLAAAQEAALPELGPRSLDGAARVAVKDKAMLLALELFPPAWLLGLDRFYLGCFRTGIAKLLLSVVTLSVGGFAWGLVDFSIVVFNALKRREALHALGMDAVFKREMLQSAFVLGCVDLAMLPMWIFLARYLWHLRKLQRMERLKENAMKSPHFRPPAA